MILYGEMGTFKSWLSKDLAYCIVNKPQWLAYPVARHNVLLVQSEVPEYEFWKRWTKYLTHSGYFSNGRYSLPLHIETVPDLKLDTSHGISQLADWVKIHNIQVVIIDNLYSTMRGDLTTNVDARYFIDNCKALRAQFGVAIIIIHHPRQAIYDSIHGSFLRQGAFEMFGSSYFTNWADTILEVRHSYEDQRFSDVLTLTPQKYRLSDWEHDAYEIQFVRRTAQFRVLV